MTKQELAEKMAEFCGESYEQRVAKGTTEHTSPLNGAVTIWAVPEKKDWLNAQEFHFFRPNGFFTVWDKLDSIKIQDRSHFDFVCDAISDIYQYKKNRYTAFYTAVHEMLEEKR